MEVPLDLDLGCFQLDKIFEKLLFIYLCAFIIIMLFYGLFVFLAFCQDRRDQKLTSHMFEEDKNLVRLCGLL